MGARFDESTGEWMHTLAVERGHLRREQGSYEEGMIGQFDALHACIFGMSGHDHAVLDQAGHLCVGNTEVAEVKPMNGSVPQI